MGGAMSVDKASRTVNKTWWEEEVPGYSECEIGFYDLKGIIGRLTISSLIQLRRIFLMQA